MLSNLLAKLENILSDYKKKISSNEILKLAKALEHYSGGIIPSPVIRRELSLSNEETEDLMIYLEVKGVLKSKFKVCCPNVSQCITEKTYDDVRKIPKKSCDKCDNGCMYVENIVVVFEVL